MYAAMQRNHATINPGAVRTLPHVFEKNRLSSLWRPSHFLIRLLKKTWGRTRVLPQIFGSGTNGWHQQPKTRWMHEGHSHSEANTLTVPFHKQGAVSQLAHKSSAWNFHWLSWPSQHNPPPALFFNINELDWFHYSTTVPWEKSQIH